MHAGCFVWYPFTRIVGGQWRREKTPPTHFENVWQIWNGQPKTLDTWTNVHAVLVSPSVMTFMMDDICTVHLFSVCGLLPHVCRRGRWLPPWGVFWAWSVEIGFLRLQPWASKAQCKDTREEKEDISRASAGWKECPGDQRQAAVSTTAQKVTQLAQIQGSPEYWEGDGSLVYKPFYLPTVFPRCSVCTS